MSPAVKTPGTLVIQFAVAPDVAALGHLDAELVEHAAALGAEEPHREQHEIGFSSNSLPGTARTRVRPFSRHDLDLRPRAAS